MAEVIWTIPALNDLETILEYIALDDPIATENFAKKVFDEVDQLYLFESFPLSGSVSKELKGTRYRRFLIPPIVLYHRKEKEKVFIVHIARAEQKFNFQNIISSGKP